MNYDEHMLPCARAALAADFNPVPWDDAPDWRREAAFAIALSAICSTSPDKAREAWFNAMTGLGWRWDRLFDEEKKTHPGLVEGELTQGGTRHWVNVINKVRDVGLRVGIRMTGPHRMSE